MILPKSSRGAFALIALIAAAVVAAGLLVGELMRINPCPLCIFQRLLYLLIAFWALCGTVAPGARRVWGVLIAATALAGIATAGYQSWMQLYPALAVECGYGEMNPVERLVDWLGMQWPALFMATGFCTSKESILGLSLANWSIPCFIAFLFAGVWVARSRRFQRFRFR
ncbi:MAG: disulfide bond formation protein B [Azospira sp.]|jgi:disulfide bond formation protein DsbB|nr:disulfide bond formation protein B [Azospira sp.]